jgi:hypothetical protein
MARMENNVVLTKENMSRRNWPGDPSCCFCLAPKSIDHLFFLCPVAKAIWGLVGIRLGATNIPGNLSQYKIWVQHWLPGGVQYTRLRLQQFAGPFGNEEMKPALITSRYGTRLKS